MPQSAWILTTACPKPAVPLEGCQREYGSHSFRPSTKIQICRAVVVPILLIRRRDVGSLSEADQATGAVSPTLLVLHPWHQMARPRVERRSPQESQPAQHGVHPASGAAALGWPRHKDGRRTHAQSRLLQQAPRRKARSWCPKKALQRPAEETACTGGNQTPVLAAEGLRPRQLALISEKSQS